MLSCQNNPKNSYTERKAKDEPSGWAIFTRCSLDTTKNNFDYYRGMDCIKVLCKKLKDHALKIISHDKKKKIPLSEEENKSYEEQDVHHICKEQFYLDGNENENDNKENENDENENDKNKKYRKVKDHCHYTRKFRGAAHNYCDLRYNVPKKIPIVIHNAGYDTHFIINLLAEEFKSGFICVGEILQNILLCWY